MIVFSLLLALGAASPAIIVVLAVALSPFSHEISTAHTPVLAAAAAAAASSGATTARTASSSSATTPSPLSSPTTPRPAGRPQDPADSGLPKTTLFIIAGVGVPLLLGLIGSVTIWGYILGRRHESTERDEEEEQASDRRKRGRRRASALIRYELDGKEVLEMETRANRAEMDDDQRPPAEMEGRQEPAELPAESWAKLLGTLR